MPLSSPVLTATSALLRRAPVAKAFISGASKMPTSGMPMPAACAWRRTVSTSQLSAALRGCSMTRTPIMRLADELRHRQRDERAAEAEHGGEDQQGVEVEAGALLVEDAVDAEQPQA